MTLLFDLPRLATEESADIFQHAHTSAWNEILTAFPAILNSTKNAFTY